MKTRRGKCLPSTRPGLAKAEWLAMLAATSLLLAMLIPALLPQSSQEREKANLVRCQANLHAIGAAMQQYLHDNAGELPVSDTLENPHPEIARAMSRYLSDVQVLYCPSATDCAERYSPEHFRAGDIGYFYYGADRPSSDASLSKFLLSTVEWPRKLDASSSPDAWLMSDIWKSGVPTAHVGFRKGVNYLQVDGSVGFVSESPRQAFH